MVRQIPRIVLVDDCPATSKHGGVAMVDECSESESVLVWTGVKEHTQTQTTGTEYGITHPNRDTLSYELGVKS